MIHIAITLILCVYTVSVDGSRSYGKSAEYIRGGKSKQTPVKILGGVETDITSVPYQVSIMINKKQVCGGTILDSTHILTAAHCIFGEKKNAVVIRAASNTYTHNGTLHRVKGMTRHPKFSMQTTENDIAMIELTNPIKESPSAKAIQIATEEPKAGDQVVLSGWGAMEEGDDLSPTLQTVTVSVVNRDECRKQLSWFKTVTSNMWCAGHVDGGKDSCQGDSGGPAVVNGKVAGVVSWGNGCGRKDYPGVYTNVAKYTKWIKKQLKTSIRRIFSTSKKSGTCVGEMTKAVDKSPCPLPTPNKAD